MSKGKLIVFSAPSGSGKTTLVQYLLNKKLNLINSLGTSEKNLLDIGCGTGLTCRRLADRGYYH